MADAKKSGDAPARSDLWSLIRKAEGGDESVIPALRQALTEKGGLLEDTGNLARQVEATLIGKAAGENLFFKEGLKAKMNRLRSELAGPDAPPLERLLADRIALCWLALHEAEVRFAQADGLTWKQVEYWQRRIDSSHKRYLSAIKTLATVRKLAIPALQVNIARKQTNVVVPTG